MGDRFLKDDQEARRDALDVTRSFIVQAPAGSGKTELLIQRYLKLLSVVQYPEEVLAITFTRKAAAEMQLRVLEALRNKMRGEEPPAEHERLTYRLAGAALEKSDALQWDLVANPRRMRILTLDALNASIARAKPLTAPETGARVVVGAELHALYRAAGYATLDWLVETGHLQNATVEVLQHVDNNTALYASYLAQMLGSRDQWLPFIGSGLLSAAEAGRLRERFEESLDFAVSEHLQRTQKGLLNPVYSELGQVFDHAAKHSLQKSGSGSSVNSSAIAELSGLSALPRPIPEDIRRWQGIAELLVTQKGQFRKKVDKRQGFPANDKPKKELMQALLEAMAGDDELVACLQVVPSLPPTRYTDEQWQVLLALFKLLPLAVTELKRLCNEQGVADHIDVALMAGVALGTADNPGDVALLLDYQIRHLLVDEMQDTSAAQYRMLETLTGGWEPDDGRSLYCVGDPMQSVYRFRNAEVGQFLLAKEYGIGPVCLESLLLRRNFRSGEFLVDWFNTVFPTVLATHDDPLRGAVSYSEAVAVEQLKGQGGVVLHAVFESDLAVEAAAGCRAIRETLRDNPDDNMAILVRGRTQLPRLLADLRAAGIPYQSVEIDRLTDLAEVLEVLALTRAAVHPGDRIAWLGVLRAPWIGLDWADIHALVRNDSAGTVWEILQDEQRLGALSDCGQRAIRRSLPVLETLLQSRRSQGLRDTVERAWFALGGPGILDNDYAVENVYRFFDVLSGLERGGTLNDVGELESLLDMERVSTSGSARLQVMTMHRAKGLQFDHVMLFGLGRQPGKGGRRVLSWFDLPAREGEARKIISPVGPRAEVNNDPIHRYIELTESAKDRQEQARLLYVACTRAKKTLHLMGNTALSADGETLKAPRSDSLLHLLWPAVEPEFARQFESHESQTSQTDISGWAAPVLRRLTPLWTLPHVEPLRGTTLTAESTTADTAVEFYWVGSEARVAGTLVHRWLQRIADGHVSIDANTTLREVNLRWLKESGIGGDTAIVITKRVEQAVESMQGDDKGRWILEGPGHAELALSGVYEEEVVSVVLDRVRVDDDGDHWIIDYKTSVHEGGNLDAFLQVETDRYRPQLVRYASIYSDWSATERNGAKVRCALYFPLLKTFREVPWQNTNQKGSEPF